MRISVNLGDELQIKVDKYANMCGVTRSSFCAMLISQGILAYDKGFEVIDSLKESLPKAFTSELAKDTKKS